MPFHSGNGSSNILSNTFTWSPFEKRQQIRCAKSFKFRVCRVKVQPEIPKLHRSEKEVIFKDKMAWKDSRIEVILKF